MERFLEFLKANIHTFLFLVIEVISLVMIFGSSDYRKSTFLGTASLVAGEISEISHSLNTYTDLRVANVELMRQNAELEVQALRLRSMLNRLSVDSLSWQRLTMDTTERAFPYNYIVAEVVGNTKTPKSNYLTLDVGTEDGVLPDMGVVGPDGVIGVVEAVGKKYAKVLPLINSRFEISAKLSSSDYIGTLVWDGRDIFHTQITNLPKHIKYAIGDSVFTSGYSDIFPEHVFIGLVDSEGVSENDNFFSLRIRFATNFNTIKYAYVLTNYDKDARMQVEGYEINSGESNIFGPDSLTLLRRMAVKSASERKDTESKQKDVEARGNRALVEANRRKEEEQKVEEDSPDKGDSATMKKVIPKERIDKEAKRHEVPSL